MRCPGCGVGRLSRDTLEESLVCRSCSKCGGAWLRLQDYLRWQEKGNAPQPDEGAEVSEIQDSCQALICPETDRMMLKYHLTKDVEHRVDLSRYAYAVWLDAGEWALLKREGLAGNLIEIFTDGWQQRIRDAQTKDTLDAMYQDKFGDAAYGELKRMRQWLLEHDHRSGMLGFLTAQDPYAA